MIQTNNEHDNLRVLLLKLGEDADSIKIASAFYSDSEITSGWADQSKNIHLIVSLRPPTNYYSLKSIQIKSRISIHFLGDSFHSKFILFFRNNRPKYCVIGSSNFTSGGLFKNIETNVLLEDPLTLDEMADHFNHLFNQSYILQPIDLENYKPIYEKALRRLKQTEGEQKVFQRKVLGKRTLQQKKKKINPKAKQYLIFWRQIDDVKEIVKDISSREYPGVPIYLTIDHFWHWIKTVWFKENKQRLTINERGKVIPKLFLEYCKWDKTTYNHTLGMAKRSKEIYSKLLSTRHIDKLTIEEARIVYKNLHSSEKRVQRFYTDISFVHENKIEKIRSSLKYLLYSNDDIELRIHNLCHNPAYKLVQLSYSGIQEIIGWVNPDRFPLRNEKADFSIQVVGYDLNS
jgi:hypothetical protein